MPGSRMSRAGAPAAACTGRHSRRSRFGMPNLRREKFLGVKLHFDVNTNEWSMHEENSLGSNGEVVRCEVPVDVRGDFRDITGGSHFYR